MEVTRGNSNVYLGQVTRWWWCPLL